MAALTDRANVFREAITAFIDEQRDAKLKGNANPDELAKFEYEAWLIEIARVAKEVQVTTHPLKATYPDAKIYEATSPLALPGTLPDHKEIGSHLIKEMILDGTGNAPSLRAIRFVSKVLVEGKPLIFWILDDDADLYAALGDHASAIVESLKKVWRVDDAPASHGGAKQLYWLVGEEPAEDDEYHLLQPLFSSTLAHAVHKDIQLARFGEANKTARHARRDKIPHSEEYHDYRDLAVRKLGGTKPQNISQLNSERGGINYLLSSLPPKWTSSNRIKLLHVDTVLSAFRWFEDVPSLLKTMSDFLLSDPDQVKETREKREALEQALGQQLALFGQSIRLSQAPGWTRDAACRLPNCEKLWLDPERIGLALRETHEDEDRKFNEDYVWGDWPDEVASRFANWLNNYLRDKKITNVGDVEHKHWAKQAVLEGTSWPIPQQRRAIGGGV